MSIRTRLRYHLQWKRHWLTILNHTVCRWMGHRRDQIATDYLGCCGRCFRDWEPDATGGDRG